LEYVYEEGLYVTPTGLRVVVAVNDPLFRLSVSSILTPESTIELPVQLVAVPLETVAVVGGLK
jgi:hypothetical protein